MKKLWGLVDTVFRFRLDFYAQIFGKTDYQPFNGRNIR